MWVLKTIKELNPREPLLLGGIILLAIALNVTLWILTAQLFPQESTAAILHYSTELGIDFIGEGSHIATLPRIGATLIIVNLILGFAIASADRRASWVLWSSLPLFQLILLGAFYLLWRINS